MIIVNSRDKPDCERLYSKIKENGKGGSGGRGGGGRGGGGGRESE